MHFMQISQGTGVYAGRRKEAHTCLDKRIEPMAQNLHVLFLRGRAVEQLAKLLLLLIEG